RDYVVRSFNADKPYDRFVQEQLAGDVLDPVTCDGIVAAGFLTAGPWDEVGHTAASPSVRARAREEELEDLIGLGSQTFLGMTVNCARCHDHKFDPIPQRDYYRLKAAFDGVYPGDRPILPAAVPAAPLAYSIRPRQPGPTFQLVRGDPEKKGDQVTAGGLSCV